MCKIFEYFINCIFGKHVCVSICIHIHIYIVCEYKSLPLIPAQIDDRNKSCQFKIMIFKFKFKFKFKCTYLLFVYLTKSSDLNENNYPLVHLVFLGMDIIL
jgi:hypothetical protein